MKVFKMKVTAITTIVNELTKLFETKPILATRRLVDMFDMTPEEAKVTLTSRDGWSVNRGGSCSLHVEIESLREKTTRRLFCEVNRYKCNQRVALTNISEMFPEITVVNALAILKKEKEWTIRTDGTLSVHNDIEDTPKHIIDMDFDKIEQQMLASMQTAEDAPAIKIIALSPEAHDRKQMENFNAFMNHMFAPKK